MRYLLLCIVLFSACAPRPIVHRVQRSIVARCGPPDPKECQVTITQCAMGSAPDNFLAMYEVKDDCRLTTWGMTYEESKKVQAGFWRPNYPEQK